MFAILCNTVCNARFKTVFDEIWYLQLKRGLRWSIEQKSIFLGWRKNKQSRLHHALVGISQIEPIIKCHILFWWCSYLWFCEIWILIEIWLPLLISIIYVYTMSIHKQHTTITIFIDIHVRLFDPIWTPIWGLQIVVYKGHICKRNFLSRFPNMHSEVNCKKFANTIFRLTSKENIREVFVLLWTIL